MKHLLKVMFAVALTVALPGVAHAKIKVCNTKGECSIGRWANCGDIYVPKTWTCTVMAMVRPGTGDKVIRVAGGRASLVLGGRTMPIISDDLVARWSRKKPTAKEFEAGMANDKGAVSEQALQALAKEMKVPIAAR